MNSTSTIQVKVLAQQLFDGESLSVFPLLRLQIDMVAAQQ
jgi:hypothetical protein